MSNLLLEDFKLYIGVNRGDDIADDDTLQAAIDAGEEAINSELGRILIAVDDDTVASAREYQVGIGDRWLAIHDCAEVVSVSGANTESLNSTFKAYPLGHLDDTGDYRPYDRLRHYTGWFGDNYWGIVTVVGKWGWASLPSRAFMGSKLLAKDIVDNATVKFGVAGFAEYGAVRVRENAVVARMIDPLRKGGVAPGLAIA